MGSGLDLELESVALLDNSESRLFDLGAFGRVFVPGRVGVVEVG